MKTRRLFHPMSITFHVHASKPKSLYVLYRTGDVPLWGSSDERRGFFWHWSNRDFIDFWVKYSCVLSLDYLSSESRFHEQKNNRIHQRNRDKRGLSFVCISSKSVTLWFIQSDVFLLLRIVKEPVFAISLICGVSGCKAMNGSVVRPCSHRAGLWSNIVSWASFGILTMSFWWSKAIRCSHYIESVESFLM